MTEKEEQIRDGQDAQIVLENPLVINAFNQILNDGYQQWISTKATEKMKENLFIINRLLH